MRGKKIDYETAFAKIEEAIASGNYLTNPAGFIVSGATLKQLGFSNNRYLVKHVRETARKNGLYTSRTGTIPEFFEHRVSSMPFDDKTTAMGWENIQQPAVYAIVCSATGRMYIGSSKRPDLRRAVHLYWLKNFYKWGISNVFFGSLKVAEDVIKHTHEAFYMTIIKSMPGATTLQLQEEEDKIIAKHDPEILYNLIHERKKLPMWIRFAQYDETLSKLKGELEDAEYYQAQYRNKWKELQKTWFEHVDAKPTDKVLKEQWKEKREQLIDEKREVRALIRKYDRAIPRLNKVINREHARARNEYSQKTDFNYVKDLICA